MFFTVKYKACPNPGIPKNGRRTGNDFGIGKSIRFTCQSGFKLTGSPVRKCLKNKQWSGTVAVCDDGSKLGIYLIVHQIQLKLELEYQNLSNGIKPNY